MRYNLKNTETEERTSEFKELRTALLEHRNTQDGRVFWPWLDEIHGSRAGKVEANKFLLGASVDFQQPTLQVWPSVRRFAEHILGDPPDLWDRIAAYSACDWNENWKTFGLHRRFRWAHNRVRSLAMRIVAEYQGDATRIWDGHTAAMVKGRFMHLGVGRQISSMAVGALVDTSQISGVGDIKADLHVRRVLGRVLIGTRISETQAVALARRLNPENPWLLDRPLFDLGQERCCPTRPDCSNCYLSHLCVWASTNR